MKAPCPARPCISRWACGPMAGGTSSRACIGSSSPSTAFTRVLIADMSTRARLLVTSVALLLLPEVARAQLRLSDCVTEGLSSRCGTLRVPEDPSTPTSRTLTLAVLVVRHRTAALPKEPLFILKGGPGEAATDDVEDTIRLFGTVLHDHDLVLINQRGTNPGSLRCEPAARAFLVPRDREPCLRRLTAKADLRMYTTEHFVADLEAARAALGYDRINVWGGSYGSRAGYVYAKRYPSHVRSIVLVAPAPLAASVLDNYEENGRRALDAVVSGCLADAGCRRTFPAVVSQVAALRSGLTDRFEQFGLQALLYSSATANTIPFIAARVAAGDRAPLEGAIQEVRASLSAGLTLGLNLAVFCSEELPYREPGVNNRRSFLREEYEEACRDWPQAAVVPDFRTVVRLGIPALVIAGERDPATPPQWAQLAAAQFTTSQVVTVAGEGHLLNRLGTCVGEMTRDFIDRGRADASCSRIRPLPYRLR
jgi:pimeloyl-ACP methyl ester carboxylesterase